MLHNLPRGAGIAVQESLAGHYETGSTIAALLRIVIPERLEMGCRFVAGRKTFDRLDVLALASIARTVQA